MSTLEQAAQQALEALEPYADIKPRDWKTDREKLWRSYDALRAALAEPDHIPDAGKMVEDLLAEYDMQESSFANDLRALLQHGVALAEPQEPIAWGMFRPDGLILDVICPDEHEAYEGEYTVPLCKCQPRKRLTDGEIKACLLAVDPETKRLPPGMKAFARAIEAAVWGDAR